MANAKKNELDANTIELLANSARAVEVTSNALDVMLSRPSGSSQFSTVDRSHLRQIKVAMNTISNTIATLAGHLGIAIRVAEHKRGNLDSYPMAKTHSTNNNALSKESLLTWLDINAADIANDLDPGQNITPSHDIGN